MPGLSVQADDLQEIYGGRGTPLLHFSNSSMFLIRQGSVQKSCNCTFIILSLFNVCCFAYASHICRLRNRADRVDLDASGDGDNDDAMDHGHAGLQSRFVIRIAQPFPFPAARPLSLALSLAIYDQFMIKLLHSALLHCSLRLLRVWQRGFAFNRIHPNLLILQQEKTTTTRVPLRETMARRTTRKTQRLSLALSKWLQSLVQSVACFSGETR